MRRRLITVVSVVVVAQLIGAGLATAQAAGDSVVGSGSAEDRFVANGQIGCCQYAYTLDAHSGPGGEAPGGTVAVQFFGRDTLPYSFSGHVSCLSVSGTKAVIGVVVDQSDSEFGPAVGQGVTLFATDTHAPVTGSFSDREPPDADRFTVHLTQSGCPAFPTSPAFDDLYYVFNGDIAIHDAQPPATYAQCRQAGWVGYGYASHAQCIDAVHQYARQKCIFERVAHGIVAFRAKYGLGPNQDHATRHCVRLYTGF
jgi:hypothetical protein